MYFDLNEFCKGINISKRRKLVSKLKSIYGNIDILPLQGYERFRPKQKDDGQIVIAVKYWLRCEIYIDNISTGHELFMCIPFDMNTSAGFCYVSDLIEFLKASQTENYIIKPAPASMSQESTAASNTNTAASSWKGWKGGRPKKQLTDKERSSIDEMRQAGASINKIAKTLHISNRIVAAYVKP